MTKETKVGLVIGLLFIVGVVYLLHWATTPSGDEQQASKQLANTTYQPLQDDQLITLSAQKQPDLLAKSSPPAPIAPLETKKDTEPAPLKFLLEAPKPQPRFYVVKSGQTLSDVAREVYGPEHAHEYHRIQKANEYKLPNPHLVPVGIKLRIPPLETAATIPSKLPLVFRQSTYTVMSGDTLSEISAKKLGTSHRWLEIMNLNRDKLPDEYSLQPGMVLKLPTFSKFKPSASGLRLPQTPEDIY